MEYEGASDTKLDSFVTPLLTDMYQLSMAYAYWKAGKHEEFAVFDLFFRKNPFAGEYTIFCGIDEVIAFLKTYKFSQSDIEYLKTIQEWPEEFYDYLRSLDGSKIKIYAVQPGTVVFPRIPLLRVEGPLADCQLLETTLLVLVNFACLMTTNAARHRLAVGPDKTLLEFGLRRAQGPNGAMSASKYAYVGGFDGTSNVMAGKTFGMAVKGTHAHAFVSSFTRIADLASFKIDTHSGEREFVQLVKQKLKLLEPPGETIEGELAAFIAYAQASPKQFLALVDTYDVLNSGLWNFLAVALALHELGYVPIGIRLDSGDLAYQSKQARALFLKVSERFGVPFEKLTIVASDSISESVLHALNDQGHSIDAFGIGTNLVTCKTQPALGGVFKLVEINGEPKMKLSSVISKVTIPSRKTVYRLYNKNHTPLFDLIDFESSKSPQVGQSVLCRHPFDEKLRALFKPSYVEELLSLFWDGKQVKELPSLTETRERVQKQLSMLREDHLRIVNPTPYKVSVSGELYTFMHKLWEDVMPIREYE